MIFKGGKILFGRRKGAHGAGEFSFPGGHLEFGESFEGCARRETIEEAGIEIENVRFLFLANLKHYAGKQYCHVGLTADYKSGEPKIMEPDKSEEWKWYLPDALPKPLFKTCEWSVEAFKTKKNFFDA